MLAAFWKEKIFPDSMKLPPYKSFPELSGERVSLRQIQPEDLVALLEISYYDAVQATSLDKASIMQNRINEDYAAGDSIHWGIVDNLTKKLVGTCGYYRGFKKGEGELGCILLSKYRGQGHMTAALTLAIDFGFSTIGLQRIRAITNRKNLKAMKLLERLHFVAVKELENGDEEFVFESK